MSVSLCIETWLTQVIVMTCGAPEFVKVNMHKYYTKHICLHTLIALPLTIHIYNFYSDLIFSSLHLENATFNFYFLKLHMYLYMHVHRTDNKNNRSKISYKFNFSPA